MLLLLSVRLDCLYIRTLSLSKYLTTFKEILMTYYLLDSGSKVTGAHLLEFVNKSIVLICMCMQTVECRRGRVCQRSGKIAT